MSSSHPPSLSSSTSLYHSLPLSLPLSLLFSLLLLSLPVPSVQQECSKTVKCSENECCSQYGWCGTTSEYCGAGCLSQCGCGTGPNCGAQCCSQYGYCGTTAEYCVTRCNLTGGTCPGTSKKSPPPPVKKSPPPPVKKSPPPPSSSSSSRKMTVYWGQDENEGSLLAACQSGRYDIINLSFLNVWGSGRSPSLNLAGHCDPDSGECKGLSTEIKSCQNLGRKLLISMGGADGSYGFSSDSNGQTFATYMWNTFLEGSLSSSSRPLGATPLDGIDLDIESGTSTGLAAFIKAIRALMNGGTKRYLITAAPQCIYPDEWLGPVRGTVLGDTPQSFDYVWVQFYNNECGFDGSSSTALAQSWKQWSDWMAKAAPNCKLSLGLPASPDAAETGYIPQSTLISTILPNFKKSSNFGGVMLWDVNNDLNNKINGKPYSYAIKQAL